MLRFAGSGWKSWVAAVVSAGLLELPFPLAGPMPVWRAALAWIGLAPLIWALLGPEPAARPLRRGFGLGYLGGVLWYAGNCYWIYETMRLHGDLPPVVSLLILLAFSMILGGYWGLFGLALVLVRQRTGSRHWALAAAPVVWVALELAAARVTSVPWDQLGYSQVDNGLVNGLAPWTGVYGIGFLIVAVNALVAGGACLDCCERSWFLRRRTWGVAGAVLLVVLGSGVLWRPGPTAATATAVLVQPNLDVAADNDWGREEWQLHLAEYASLSAKQCSSYIEGIPQTGAPTGEIPCPPAAMHPDLVAWPESPAPFFEDDLHFRVDLRRVAQAAQAPMVAGNIGGDYAEDGKTWRNYNSALVVDANGEKIGRYDKIHLVPFGEYVPFEKFLFFARKLTGRVSKFDRGVEHKVFALKGADGETHRYGIFICYEAVFADEVRHLAANGAEVLVNISDDGWYGDSSAPWQHLNMARMRAIENRRWILRDTNNGVTAAIDPEGRVRQSIPRHRVDALVARFGYRSDVTFYAAHGDLFGWACALLALGLGAFSASSVQKRKKN